MEKIDYRTLPESERLIQRKNAIRLIKMGKKKQDVARLLGVRATTISTWVKKNNVNGLLGLQSKKRGVKSEDLKLLTLDQEKQIQGLILDKMPDQLKLNFALWTRKAVQELILNQFGITIAITTTGDYLRRWGYTPQKPKKRAYEQNSAAVQKWLNEVYPSIARKAKSENAEIHWGDETGVKNSCNHGRSYSPKGRTPVKKSMSKRFSINLISTVTNQGKVQFMIYSGSMNADRLIEFMTQLIKTSKKKVFLILDNLKVHHSKLVKEWISDNNNKIELFFLPSYSPDRNPDEFLNCDLKQGLSMKPAPRNQEVLTQNVKDHMTMLRETPSRVKKYFNADSIKYAA